MSYERIMGLNVTDDVMYQQYRDAMLPILHRYGGDFGFDFKIAEVLKSKTPEPINRVFTLAFPSESVMAAFFSDADYLIAKKQYLDKSVNAKTVIALHHTDEQP
ncbi:MAG: DUF1330 domain-containing protein [Pseudomonadales bacterium]|nr:DUF1330 domain-containing protein [Pseudomonadales bacterium]